MKALYTFLISCFCVGVMLAQSDIASVEYFVDTDPGVGLAIAIDIDPDAEIINQSFNITTSGLSVGVHRLFIRAINIDGDNSVYEHKTFYIAPNTEINSCDITDAEYFFNQDPRVGNATVIDLADVSSIDEALLISTSGLPNGIHRLFIRVKNSDYQWSLYEHKTFYLTSVSDVNTFNITAAEFFIDADPGVGNATSISVSGSTIDENLVIPTSNNLSQGDHYLYIRVLNEDGAWSLYERQFFEVSGTLGINSQELTSISIFPNPASNYLNISLSNSNLLKSVTIYDLYGKEVFKSNDSLEKISIYNLSKGTYLLILETDKGSFSKKIIKN